MVEILVILVGKRPFCIMMVMWFKYSLLIGHLIKWKKQLNLSQKNTYDVKLFWYW